MSDNIKYLNTIILYFCQLVYLKFNQIIEFSLNYNYLIKYNKT